MSDRPEGELLHQKADVFLVPVVVVFATLHPAFYSFRRMVKGGGGEGRGHVSRVLQRNPFLKQYTKTKNRSVHSFPYRRAVSRNQKQRPLLPVFFRYCVVPFCSADERQLSLKYLHIDSPHAVDINDVGVAQVSEAIVLRPQVGQSSLSLGERQVVSNPLGHHAPTPILARVDRAESPVGNVLRWTNIARDG